MSLAFPKEEKNAEADEGRCDEKEKVCQCWLEKHVEDEATLEHVWSWLLVLKEMQIGKNSPLFL